LDWFPHSHVQKAKKISQKELAEQIGVSSARFSNWEQGSNRPDVDFIAKICKALNVSPSEMLDFELPSDELSDLERNVLAQYRNKPEIRKAVNILLGIDADQ